MISSGGIRRRLLVFSSSGTEIGVCGPDADHFRTEFLMEHAFMPRSLKNSITAACDWCAQRLKLFELGLSLSMDLFLRWTSRFGATAGRRRGSPSSARRCRRRCTKRSVTSVSATRLKPFGKNGHIEGLFRSLQLTDCWCFQTCTMCTVPASVAAARTPTLRMLRRRARPAL